MYYRIKIANLFNTMLLVMMLTTVGCSTSTKEQTETTSSNPINDVVKLKNLDGSAIDLSQYEDKAIFVNFWATWCAPCIQEMPSLERMQAAFTDEPIVFFYASNEPANKIKKFAGKKPWDFNYVQLDMELSDLSIYALPTTIIFKNGEIAWTETGSKDWDSEKSIREIKAFINQ